MYGRVILSVMLLALLFLAQCQGRRIDPPGKQDVAAAAALNLDSLIIHP